MQNAWGQIEVVPSGKTRMCVFVEQISWLDLERTLKVIGLGSRIMLIQPHALIFCLIIVQLIVIMYYYFSMMVVVRDVVANALVAINEVTLRRARLVLGWVTVCGRVNRLGM